MFGSSCQVISNRLAPRSFIAHRVKFRPVNLIFLKWISTLGVLIEEKPVTRSMAVAIEFKAAICLLLERQFENVCSQLKLQPSIPTVGLLTSEYMLDVSISLISTSSKRVSCKSGAS